MRSEALAHLHCHLDTKAASELRVWGRAGVGMRVAGEGQGLGRDSVTESSHLELIEYWPD